MATQLDNYRLSKWSRLVRIRDGAACIMCCDRPGAFRLEAHHIYPKGYAKYAGKAYDLANGVSLCERCHLRVVHSTERNWRRFTAMFRQYLKRKAIMTYNENEQKRV